METALAQAKEQWRNGVEAELQMCSARFEPVDGADKVPTDSRGGVHGRAKCTYPEGHVYVGEYQHGIMHGQGTFNYASGGVHVGGWQHNKKHGRGKYTNAEGTFVLGFWVAGKPSGESVQFTEDRSWFSVLGFTKDRQKAWLKKDGKVAHELSLSEAAKKVEELGLSELLKWVLDPIWKDFWKEKSHEELSNCCQVCKEVSKELYIILTAKSTGIGFEMYSSLMFSLSCFYLQKKAPM